MPFEYDGGGCGCGTTNQGGGDSGGDSELVVTHIKLVDAMATGLELPVDIPVTDWRTYDYLTIVIRNDDLTENQKAQAVLDAKALDDIGAFRVDVLGGSDILISRSEDNDTITIDEGYSLTLPGNFIDGNSVIDIWGYKVT